MINIINNWNHSNSHIFLFMKVEIHCQRLVTLSLWGVPVPFRPNNMHALFQRTMKPYLGDINLDSILIYLDKAVMFSTTFKDHLAHLDPVWAHLQKYRCRLKLLSRIIITRQGILLDPEKVKATQEWRHPTTMADVSFLGLAGYYH